WRAARSSSTKTPSFRRRDTPRRAAVRPAAGSTMADRTRQERIFTFLLLPAIAVGVLVLTGVSFRTTFQQERLRQQSVVEATLSLANEKAARLDQLIVDQDTAVASETDLGNLSNLGRAWLPVAARQTPTVRAVLVLDL